MNHTPASRWVRWSESFGAKVAMAILGTVALLLGTTLLIVRLEMGLQVVEVVGDARHEGTQCRAAGGIEGGLETRGKLSPRHLAEQNAPVHDSSPSLDQRAAVADRVPGDTDARRQPVVTGE